MVLRPAFATLTLMGLVACAQFPDLDSALSEGAQSAEYPDLVPVEELKARLPAPNTEFETPNTLSTRIAALKARAQSLRGTVVDSPTRTRMSTGIAPIES